ncbi:MAG: rhodanese-like domain-containing protein [Proteobacteria bacterium]|nr:rhodanese-like domain-containing protein [Pseudomonadota bacterium]
MEVKKGVKALVEEAERQIQTLTPVEVDQRLQQKGVLLVDLRDIREVKRDGKIPQSLHVPRGMLEFWIDPDSPYYRTEFDQVEAVILYCNKGWRSALAAQSLQSMGLENVAHMQGGMEQWQHDIGRIDFPPEL